MGDEHIDNFNGGNLGRDQIETMERDMRHAVSEWHQAKAVTEELEVTSSRIERGRTEVVYGFALLFISLSIMSGYIPW